MNKTLKRQRGLCNPNISRWHIEQLDGRNGAPSIGCLMLMQFVGMQSGHAIYDKFLSASHIGMRLPLDG
eukprot:IDg21986t1